jgi:hypothetical protein
MSLVLMVMLTSVESGGPRLANASPAAVAHNAQAISSGPEAQNKTTGSAAAATQPVALKSKAPAASIDADCDAEIFLDCGKPTKDAIKNITYR